jgi:nucleotide-binding universal stress UspA family protein
MNPIRKILVPTDFSEASDAALDAAAYLAETFDAELVVMHAYEPPTALYSTPAYVPPPPEMYEWLKKAAEGGVAAAVAKVKERVPRTTGIVRAGTPWREIDDAAKTTGADLLVIGTRGRTGLAHALLGSVAEKVVRSAPIPVLTVHGPATDHSRR